MLRHLTIALAALSSSSLALAQRGNSPFPGGENPDGSLRPSARLSRLFTQESYTEYALLEPGTNRFRIRFFTETSRAGDSILVNATRGGSEGTDIEVYDPRTGKPMPFDYVANGDAHEIRARLPNPVPAGGSGRVLIYKTYEDARTYHHFTDATAGAGVQPGDIAWVRSLSGYRLGVILPKGYSVLSMNTAAHTSVTPDGRVKLHFANPSGQSNPFTVHARRTTTAYRASPITDVFFDDIRTLYDLGAPDAHAMRVDQVYTDYRRGAALPIDLLKYARISGVQVTDLDTARPLRVDSDTVMLSVPITNDKQSAHLQVSGSLVDRSYGVSDGVLTFDRTVRGLRNTILLPEGWEVTSVSQAATIGMYQGRAFVALINLNAENSYRVVVTAQRR